MTVGIGRSADERASAAESGGRAPAPGRGAFVGRVGELAQLLAAADDARAGRGGIALLAGDAGIGKTRIAEEVASRARQRGAAVYWGRCHEGTGAPAYWPWVQVLRAAVRETPPRILAAQLGAGAVDVAQVVPEIRQRLGDLPAARTLDAEQARFQLFDAIAGYLATAAARRPIVLVLDDLHWADTPSLLLLQFLARAVSDSALFVIATYRDVEVDSAHPLAPVLDEVCRARGFARIALRGLPAEAVRDLATAMCGETVAVSCADALMHRTEGNPFFVEELLRHCLEEGLPMSDLAENLERVRLPHGVQAIIRRRLERLAPSCNRILTVAAVIGRDFDRALLRDVLGAGGDPVDEADLEAELRHAVSARVVNEVRSGRARYRFAHALVRETLYEAQPAERRAALHRCIGEALERSQQGDARASAAQLAYHFVESSRRGGDARPAARYSTDAAREAADALAYEEAAAHYERALEALDRLGGDASSRARADVLLALAEEQMHAGQPLRAKPNFLRAAEAARACGSAEHLARAALGFETLAADLGGTEPDRVYVNLLEEAAVALEPEGGKYRARVLARLAQVPHRSMPRERRAAMSAEAVEIARRIEDPYALAYALLGRNYALWDSDPPSTRRERADEVLRCAEQAGERALALDGRLQRAFTWFELGDRAALDQEMRQFHTLAIELRQPRYLWLDLILQTCRACLTGALAEAKRLTDETLEAGMRHNRSNAMQVYALQSFAIRRETGDLEEMEPMLRSLAEQNPIAAWLCALAFLYGELGREAEARQVFERLATGDFGDVPQDPLWLISVTCLAETCAFLGDAERAARLYAMLSPYAEQGVTLGGAVSLGSAARPLGLLAATMRRYDDAVGLLEAALRFDRRMGAIPGVVRGLRDLARTLVARDDSGDRERAAQLAAEARTEAARVGMARLVEQLRDLADTPAGSAAPAADDRRFQQEGDFWTLSFAGTVVRLRDAKGLHYLAHLLRHPEREFHVVDLVAAARVATGGDTGAVLDPSAKSAYRTRLAELRDEIEEADRFNDLGRATRLRGEMSAIAQQLQSAVGVGGRDRRPGSQAERARLAVTQCVKASLKKIRQAHPALGHYLGTTIRTGYYCAYQPAPRERGDWLL